MEDPRLRIIRAGTMAPSGDNSQPWSFSISGDSIMVHMHPEKDHALLNVEDGGTLIASGAAIENMLWEARAIGKEPSLELCPGPDRRDVARITLATGGKNDESTALSAIIPLRHTNRQPYQTTELPKEFMKLLARIEGEYSPCRLAVISGTNAVLKAARAASTMEEIALQDEQLHRLFFESITWSHEEHEAGKPGLHIKTLELPPPVRALFRLLKHWSVTSALNIFGFANLAAHSNAQVYASSGAMVAIIIPDRSPQSMLQAGRLTERIWLEATRHTLVAQPLAGLIYLAAALKQNSSLINTKLGHKVRESDMILHELAEAPGQVIAMMLRVGIPLAPATARSRRMQPIIH